MFMKITFHPSFDNDDLVKAAKEYSEIWDDNGNEIVEKIERVTGFNFEETHINAIIYEGVSHSHPLCLRASYDEETKKATLVHELLHIICAFKTEFVDDNDSLALSLHKVIFLVLYDVWVDLYGKAFADRQVEIESSRTDMYKEAWSWALGTDRNSRIKLFNEIKKK